MENFRAALRKLSENKLAREQRRLELRSSSTDRARLTNAGLDVGDLVRDKETGENGRVIKTAFRSVLLPPSGSPGD